MYRSIGDNMAVRESQIIGIFDLDNTTYSKHTRNFLKNAEKNGQVLSVGDDIPKSFLLLREYGMDRILLLQVHAKTMEKRINKEEASWPIW